MGMMKRTSECYLKMVLRQPLSPRENCGANILDAQLHILLLFFLIMWRLIKEGKRNVKSRKILKSLYTSNIEEGNNALAPKQSTSSYCSEDESNGSQELNGELDLSPKSEGTAVLNSSGKSRASRGSATDPQSLYARKRRERINERLRILQNLVPNGTKVDISTMLEDAVQYVNFLQLQIKLLSSDDMWMYAPIAFNGMDIGLDLNISGPR